jgi:hypothetical protein
MSGKVCKSVPLFAHSAGKEVSEGAIRGCTGPGLGGGNAEETSSYPGYALLTTLITNPFTD